jgi:hypothetical protein
MRPTSNIMSQLIRKGVDPDTPYEAIVVDDRDPEFMFRVQFRIPVFHDGIEDDLLPWALPEDNSHRRGLISAEVGKSMSVRGVPKRNSTIHVFFRHKGDPNLATYSHKVPLTSDKVPEEFLNNYPDRFGSIQPNGMMWIADSSTGEYVLCLPGDAHLTIFGDVNQTIIGNHQIHVAKSTAAVPSYLVDTFSQIFANLAANQGKRIPFKGLKDKSSGNLHLEVEGDFTGNIGGAMKLVSKTTKEFEAGSSVSLKSSSSIRINGTRIELN